VAVNPFVNECDLSDTLRDTAENGKNVTLITRHPDSGNEKYHDILKNTGVRIFHNNRTHAKIIIVDRSVAVVSSMNFFASSSGGKSWEAGLVTIENTVVESALNAILALTEKSEPFD
jgi:phosphatidylserine/phosphatidylglycerophosphate/cardiolipin synthase-like enzyme